MNATQFIKSRLFTGKPVTSEQVFKKFGSPKTPSRIGEIERQYGIKVTRTPKSKRTQLGTSNYNVYSLDLVKWGKKLMN